MASLNRTITLAEVYNIAVAVGNNLNLDVAGIYDVFFLCKHRRYQRHFALLSGRVLLLLPVHLRCLLFSYLYRRRRLFAFTITGYFAFFSKFLCCIHVINKVGTGRNRNTVCCHGFSCCGFVAHFSLLRRKVR